MMQLSDLLDADAVIPDVKARSKKQLLQTISGYAARFADIDATQIFESLLQREKLGSTGLGHGVAIPHGKFPGLDRVHGLFARLSTPVDYDAVDGEPVDLVFLLMAPENAGADHLKALARVSRLFRDPSITGKLRGTSNAKGLYAILTEPSASTSNAA